MNESDLPSNRRHDVRYPLTLAGAATALYRRSPDGSPASPRFTLETINVSRGGMMVAFDQDVSDGDVLVMHFTGPDTGAGLEVEGRIQWLRRNTTGLLGKFFAGVMFRDRDAEAVRRLVDHAAAHAPPDPNH